ncbi:hypothetical protein HA466_0106790 [Hirschfeldia incana]|nr:hypothetical protein HA466_0106790 [Hirschfeldia incana]
MGRRVQTREWVLQVGYWQADRCHKAPVKKTQTQSQHQEKEKVVSVVTQKAETEVSLAEVTQEGEKGAQEEGIQKNKSRARSRSWKRSRSRARTRTRALSSTPEILAEGGTKSSEPSEMVLVGLLKDSPSPLLSEKEEIQSASSAPPVKVDKVGLQLEEGEIREEELDGKCVSQSESVLQEGSNRQVAEESVWFTKHSRNYRRAIRQHELWKA